MATLLEYKCPCCGGAIQFDSTLQKMKCPYCDTEFEMETLAAMDDQLKSEQADDMSWENQPKQTWDTDQESGMRSYVCKSCGGEILGDENLAATSCPFCGNPVVMTGMLSGMLKPDYVLPFRVDREAAKQAYRNFLKGKRLLPKVFRDENRINEMKGMYVPFWLFDANADASIRYRATRVRTWSDGRYIYTETGHYSLFRAGTLSFAGVPVDGSSKIGNDLTESLEPFDFSQAVDFQTAYLAGYLADKYDVSAEDTVQRANERIRHSTEQAFAQTVQGYTTVTAENSGIRLQNGNAKYALYPIWFLNTAWNGRQYSFAMNGQSGKFIGNLPVDKKAARLWTLGLTAAFSAVIFGISYLFWLL